VANKDSFWINFLPCSSLELMAFIALLPIILFSLPFFMLEFFYLFDIRVDNPSILPVILLPIIALSLVLAKALTNMMYFPTAITRPVFNWIDIALSLFLLSFVFYKFFENHYVTPSSSVLYYIFYDYLRLFSDTGFYRPGLPDDNPSGTWLSMLTYNPSVGIASGVFYTGHGLTGFKDAFALLTAIVNIGAISWIGLFSRHFNGLFFPGIAIGFSVFAYTTVPGLVQMAATIGSHDLPLLYFSVASVAIALISFKGLHSLPPISLKALALFNVGVITLGVSLRPYLLPLALVTICFSTYVFYIATFSKNALNNSSSILQNKKIHVFIFAVSVFLFVSGAYWFLLSFILYDTPVVYNHSSQFKNFSSFSNVLIKQLNTTYGVLINDAGGRAFLTEIHYEVVMGSCVVSAIIMAFKRSLKPFVAMAVAFCLLLVIPLITQTATHWKSLYAASIIMYLYFPLLTFSALLFFVNGNKVKINFFQVVASCCLIYVFTYLSVLPEESYKSTFIADQGFRKQVATLRDDNERMLVLRGGEPGGDGQSYFDKYYYWNNAFFFGDIDRYFKEGSPSINEFYCILQSRNIGLIFDPTTLKIQNHSGDFAYNAIVELIKTNNSVFTKAIERSDGYKGVVYQVKHSILESEECLPIANNEKSLHTL